ncbi:hypothetical protein Tco_0077477 [Tanacetum coccineum]
MSITTTRLTDSMILGKSLSTLNYVKVTDGSTVPKCPFVHHDIDQGRVILKNVFLRLGELEDRGEGGVYT